MSTDSALGKGLNVMTLGLYRPVMKALFPGSKGQGADINTDPGQTSTYGAFITRTHGTIGQSGNIIWLEGNKLRAVVKKAKKSGKGGGAPAGAATVSYFATFAVGLCEGPIAGVRRIWIGPDLIYDAGSDDLGTIIASNSASSGFTPYLGTDTQQPDPRIQADRGTANTPAYRGLAYIVIKDLALANYGNSIAGAQVRVEVVNSQTVSATRKLVETVPITAVGSPQPGYLQSGSIIDLDGSGAYAMDGVFGGPKAYRIDLNGGASNPIAVGATDIYANTRSLMSDSADFAGWLGNVLNAHITADGIIYSGTINQTTGQLVKKDGQFYYFEEGGTVARKCSRSSDPITIKNYTIAASVSQCVYGAYAYGLSPARDSLYAWNISDFTMAYSVPVSPSIFSGTSGDTITYTDGSILYSARSTGSAERIISIDLATGATEIYGDFEVRPGTNSSGAIRISGDLYQRLYYGDVGTEYRNTVTYRTFQRSYASGQTVPLSTIVATEAARSALIKPADIDTAELTGSVIGYRVTSSGSIRNALEPLRAAYPFDAFQSGYKIKFRSRGAASVATIPIGDLAADTQLEESREMDSQLPSRVSVQYLDRNRDYDQNEQEDARLGANDGDTQDVSIQVVMTGAQAKQVAEKLLALAWLERTAFSFKLPPIYGRIEAADTIKIVADYAVYELMLGSVSHDSDGMLSCTGVPSNASLYTSSTPADEGQQPPVTIPLQGSTFGALIDCPVIDETLQNSPGFIVGLDGYSSGWSGGTLFRSTDSGQTWADVQAFSGRATIGFASTVLGAHSGSLIQRGGSLTVSASGLEGVTEAQMLGGSNIAAYGAPGRWEVIRFQNATLNGDGTYTLDTFWRGDKGTEWATGLHVAGDTFVLLTDPDLVFVGMATESIGLPRDYRMITFDADIDSAASQPFTYAGANLECLSPVYAKGTRSSGDLAAAWTRRSRLSSSWWTNGVVAPIGETTEAYEVDVMQGAAVKRTISSVTPAITYTSAQQVTDFGSAQASITLKIYQLSTAVGRGLPLEVTL